MPFESGSVSFRMFYMPGGLPDGHLARFRERAAPPIDTLGSDPIRGWVTSRHLLDRNIVEETAYVAGMLRLDLMKAERKIPAALLRAECRMEELAVMESRGWDSLSRKARSEIKAEVTDRLLPTMPPTLTGIPVVAERDGRMLLAGAMSEKQHDALLAAYYETAGRGLVPLTPESAAQERLKVDAAHVAPSSFSPECEDSEVSDRMGQDFLTWLWFHSEQREGAVELPGQGTFHAMVEGPLTFVREGNGAHETVLRNGEPRRSQEARAALLAGKKLARAKITLVRGDAQYTATLGADDFAVRSLKLPDTESLDAAGRFMERMLSVRIFIDALLAYYDAFLQERLSAQRWPPVQRQIHDWVERRETRR